MTSINAQELIFQAKQEIVDVQNQINALQKKANQMAEKNAISIAKKFLKNDLNFPVEIIELSQSGALKSLVIFLQSRLLRESELSNEMLQFLVREKIAKNTLIQEKIQESFNSWSESVQFKFALSCPYEHMFFRYNFLHDYLLKYSIGQNTNFFKEKGFLYLFGYNPNTLSSNFKLRLDLIESSEQVKIAAQHILKSLELGYSNNIYFSDIEFFLFLENNLLCLTESQRNYPTEYTFHGSIEEQLIQAIEKALELKKDLEERDSEDSY